MKYIYVADLQLLELNKSPIVRPFLPLLICFFLVKNIFKRRHLAFIHNAKHFVPRESVQLISLFPSSAAGSCGYSYGNIYTDCEGPSNWRIGGVVYWSQIPYIWPGQKVSQVTRGNFPLSFIELYIVVHLIFTAKNPANRQHSALLYVRRTNTIPTG